MDCVRVRSRYTVAPVPGRHWPGTCTTLLALRTSWTLGDPHRRSRARTSARVRTTGAAKGSRLGRARRHWALGTEHGRRLDDSIARQRTLWGGRDDGRSRHGRGGERGARYGCGGRRGRGPCDCRNRLGDDLGRRLGRCFRGRWRWRRLKGNCRNGLDRGACFSGLGSTRWNYHDPGRPRPTRKDNCDCYRSGEQNANSRTREQPAPGRSSGRSRPRGRRVRDRGRIAQGTNEAGTIGWAIVR